MIVGVEPGRLGGVPLSTCGASGPRLARLMGLTAVQYEERFDRVNLHATTGGHDDRAAATNLGCILRGRRVLALGKRVCRVLDIRERFRWTLARGFVAAGMPHPSGRGRWWNDPGNRRTAAEFLSRVWLPCVHVEGCDGSGKSTLVSRLAAATGLSAAATEDPPCSWDECLRRIGRRLDPGTLCDRSSGLVSELVYGPVLRGKTVAPEDELWSVVRSVVGVVTFVYCRTGNPRPGRRPGESLDHIRSVEQNLERLRARYDEVFERMEADGARVLRFDWTRDCEEGLARRIGLCAE